MINTTEIVKGAFEDNWEDFSINSHYVECTKSAVVDGMIKMVEQLNEIFPVIGVDGKTNWLNVQIRGEIAGMLMHIDNSI